MSDHTTESYMGADAVSWKRACALILLAASAATEADFVPTTPAMPLEGEQFAITINFSAAYKCDVNAAPLVFADQVPTIYVSVGSECFAGGSITTFQRLADVPGLPVGIYKVVATLDLGTGFEPPPQFRIPMGTVRVTRSETATQEIVVEYYNGPTRHFFMTPLQNEIELLDARQSPFEYWERTGETFKVAAPGKSVGSQQAVSICRFYNDSFSPSSHFYAAHGLGCEETRCVPGQLGRWSLSAVIDSALSLLQQRRRRRSESSIYRAT
jgi:hypothetical protein